MTSKIIISMMLGYIFGLFQTSYFISLLLKKDLRKLGSGNLGATNAMRNFGKKVGAVTFFLDGFKGFAACMLVSRMYISSVDILPLLMSVALLGAIIGHCFPLYLRFNGGKGVSTLVGGIVFIDIKIAVVGIIIFLIILYFSKIVSVSSLVMAFSFMSIMIFLVVFEKLFIRYEASILFILSYFVIYVVILIRHIENIKRFARNEERRIGNGTRHKIS